MNLIIALYPDEDDPTKRKLVINFELDHSQAHKRYAPNAFIASNFNDGFGSIILVV